jgi:hypothetical protein
MLCKVHIRDALAKCYNMYLDRFSENGRVTFCTDTFLIYLESLLHEDDLPIYEQVHRDYSRITCYGKNTMAVDETMVRVPVMQRPDTHVAPVEKIQEMDPPKQEAAAPAQQPLPTPPTSWETDEPDDKEMEAAYTMCMTAFL